MAVTPTLLYSGGQLGSSAGTLVTGPANTIASIISAASFTNLDTVPRSFTIYLVRSGGTAGPANVIIDAKQLASTQTYVCVELQNQILNVGDTLQAAADVGAKVTCAGISGYVVTQ